MSHCCCVCAPELSPNISSLCEQLVDTCIATYNTVQTQLLPTPAKSHYTFNLRDLSKVIQGILMGEPDKVTVCSESVYVLCLCVCVCVWGGGTDIYMCMQACMC